MRGGMGLVSGIGLIGGMDSWEARDLLEAQAHGIHGTYWRHRLVGGIELVGGTVPWEAWDLLEACMTRRNNEEIVIINREK